MPVASPVAKSSIPPVVCRHLGTMDYRQSWQMMKEFTDSRLPATADELWFLQHPPVFTLGKNGKADHILNSMNIPVIKTDRGGQVTFHGPRQIVVYTLLDLNRLKLGIRELVRDGLQQVNIEHLRSRQDLLAEMGAERSAKDLLDVQYQNMLKE